MEPFTTIPAGVGTRIEQDGQSVIVVKLQEAYRGVPEALQQHLTSHLGLPDDALLLVLPTEGQPLIGRGRAQELYNKYLSTNTDAVSETTWKPLSAGGGERAQMSE
jgi:hypothetical protein